MSTPLKPSGTPFTPSPELVKMIEDHQCPGCVGGLDTRSCAYYKPVTYGPGNGAACSGHTAGTSILGLGNILLGMPKGFNRTGDADNKPDIRLYDNKADFGYPLNKYNMAVWGYNHGGRVFLRIYSPRVNHLLTAVVMGATREELAPDSIDVGEFIDEID